MGDPQLLNLYWRAGDHADAPEQQASAAAVRAGQHAEFDLSSKTPWAGCSDYMKCVLYFERLIEQNRHSKAYYVHGVVDRHSKKNQKR